METTTELIVDSPSGRQAIFADHDQSRRLSDLLNRHEMPLNTRCGCRGLCDGCVVELVRGSVAHEPTGAAVSANGHAVSIRGCEHAMVPGQSVQLRIPARALLVHRPQIVNQFRLNIPHALAPIRKPTATANLGVAIDVGTTTVAVIVVDLTTQEIVGRASAFNKQMHLGDNVLTRINLCSTDPTMLGQLQEAINVRTLRKLLAEAMGEAKATVENLACLSIAANTTMLHLLAGVDPTSMGYAPFTAPFLEHRVLDAVKLGIVNGPSDGHNIEVHLLPSAAAYVGADLTAGVLSSGLLYDDGPSLLVDVGTNGEIILRHGDKLLGCATAAGPAFEGAGLTCGVRAGDGAISHLTMTADPFDMDIELIGKDQGSKPIGLCGTAYIDMMAEGRRIGLLTTTGRFNRDLPGLADRIDDNTPNGTTLRIAHGLGKSTIGVTEHDIARLLQAKAAVAAGILTLLEHVGMSPADVKTLYLAGGFGMHMNIQSAIGSGLLPGFKPEQIQLVGNTSLAGAYVAMLDTGALDEIKRVSEQMKIVELNLDPEFESRYIDQLSLPD